METNTQSREGCFRNKEGILQVHSVFRTIQGEGPFAGTPAIFVRLTGCNLQCQWCDTEYTSIREETSPTDLVQRCLELSDKVVRLIVITGGEPMRQNIAPFIMTAIKAGYSVQVETNGTMHVEDVAKMARRSLMPLTIVVSPKTAKLHPDLVYHALKYVVSDGEVDDDGLPNSVLGNGHKVARPPKSFGGEVFVQPMDEQDKDKNHLHNQAAVNSCMKHGYRLCLQMHKYMGLD